MHAIVQMVSVLDISFRDLDMEVFMINEGTQAENLDSSVVVNAEHVVNKYVKWAAGAGLIPVALLDAVALTGVQVKMLADLSALYGVKFIDNQAKIIIGTMVGVAVPSALNSTAVSILKLVPYVGTALGVLTLPSLNAASTYALGKVFILHLASGGTLLDFDSVKVQDHYRAYFEAHKNGDLNVKAA